MKILKFNEANSYLVASQILKSLSDICLDLKDSGIEYSILPDDDIKIKILGLYLCGITEKFNTFKIIIDIPKNNYEIELTKDIQNSISETLNNIERLCNDENLKARYTFYYEYPFFNFNKMLSRNWEIGTPDNIVFYKRFTEYGKDCIPIKRIIIYFEKN